MNKARYFSITRLLVFGLIIIAMLYIQFVPLLKQPIVYELRPGTSKKLFISQLAQQDVLSNKLLFYVYIYVTPWKQLKAGEYLFPKDATFAMIWKQVTTGTGLNYHSFTIVPGMTFKQIKQALFKTPGLKPQLVLLDDVQLMHVLKQDNVQPEGMFLPETYFYAKGESDQVVLQKALHLMRAELLKAWSKRSNDLPYRNAYEALIAASLIEKEAKVSSEFARISGVLVNRLHKGMLLQFDPTVIYGMGDRFSGKINKVDLQTDSRYNTYIIKGLPPTPIAAPSLQAINAALHPEHHNYYYFVATGNGTHIFSTTLEEHNQAVSRQLQTTSKISTSYFNAYPIKLYLLHTLMHRINLVR